MRRFILLAAAAVFLTGCAAGSAAETETVPERFDAALYELGADSKVILKTSFEEADITGYVTEYDGELYIGSDVLTEVFRFLDKGMRNKERIFERDDARIAAAEGESFITVNGERRDLGSPVRDDADGGLCFPEDVLLLMPGISQMNKRRDGGELLISIE